MSWSTPPAAGVALCVGGVVLLGLGLLSASDPVGLVMMGVAGLLLVGFGCYALLVRPRLAIAGGAQPQLVVRTIGGSQAYPPGQIERIRLLSVRRIARRSSQLEIDVLPDPAESVGAETRPDSRLIVFSRWDLGADLNAVADELRAAGFRVDD